MNKTWKQRVDILGLCTARQVVGKRAAGSRQSLTCETGDRRDSVGDDKQGQRH